MDGNSCSGAAGLARPIASLAAMNSDDRQPADNSQAEVEGAPESDHAEEPTVSFVVDPTADESFVTTPGDFERYALVVERGPYRGVTWLLEDGETTVGRHPDDDIFLDDVTVSRHHVRMVASSGRLTVEDLGSTNGTYVNGERVEIIELAAGDEVIIGKYHLLIAGRND